MSMKKTAVAMAAVTWGLNSIATAYAGQETAEFEVRVGVSDACEISADDLDFGTYNILDIVPLTNTSNITVKCSLLTVFSVGIDQGQHGSSTTDRKMLKTGGNDQNANHLLDYTLNCVGVGVPACALNWGDIGEGSVFTSIGTGADMDIVLTGSIAPGQNVESGSYTDNPVTATVDF